jgi:cold shock CspA family protein
MRISGTVKFFNDAKGFGFILSAEGTKDVFAHASALERADIRALSEGDKVLLFWIARAEASRQVKSSWPN